MMVTRMISMSALALTLLGGSPVGWSATEQLPATPPGFGWREFETVHGALLVPDGWFVKEVLREGGGSLFITKEDMAQTGKFSTGLTINVFRHPKPSAFAERFIEGLDETKGFLPLKFLPIEGRGTPDTVQGKSRMIGISARHLIRVATCLGNNATGTVYLMSFEAPEATWLPNVSESEPFRISKTLLENVWFDTRY